MQMSLTERTFSEENIVEMSFEFALKFDLH